MGINNPLSNANQLPGTASITFVAKAVNFNSGNTDNPVTLAVPPGFTRFVFQAVRISGASGTLTTSTIGCFTGAGGTGFAVVANATAVTVNTASDATTVNTQVISPVNNNTQAYLIANTPTLFFRVVTAQGVAATADVSVQINPLP